MSILFYFTFTYLVYFDAKLIGNDDFHTILDGQVLLDRFISFFDFVFALLRNASKGRAVERSTARL